MAAVKSNSLCIFKTRYLERCYTDTFSIHTYIGVAILNILLFDLDRHSHSPFFKMVTHKTNFVISCELYHLEWIYLYHDISEWLGFTIS